MSDPPPPVASAKNRSQNSGVETADDTLRSPQRWPRSRGGGLEAATAVSGGGSACAASSADASLSASSGSRRGSSPPSRVGGATAPLRAREPAPVMSGGGMNSRQQRAAVEATRSRFDGWDNSAVARNRYEMRTATQQESAHSTLARAGERRGAAASTRGSRDITGDAARDTHSGTHAHSSRNSRELGARKAAYTLEKTAAPRPSSALTTPLVMARSAPLLCSSVTSAAMSSQPPPFAATNNAMKGCHSGTRRETPCWDISKYTEAYPKNVRKPP